MKELICIVCPKGCHLTVDENNDYAVSGNTCKRGEVYGKEELRNPVRVLTSTVCISGSMLPRVPVKTTTAIPKGKLFEAMKVIDELYFEAPVACGDVLLSDILGTGVDIVATRDMPKV